MLNILNELPKNKRPSFVLRLYGTFGVFIVILFGGAIFFLLRSGDIEKGARATEISSQLRILQAQTQAEVDSLAREAETLRAQLSNTLLLGIVQRSELELRTNELRSRFEEKRKSLNKIDALLADLLKPSPYLMEALEEARNIAAPERRVQPVTASFAIDLSALEATKQALAQKTQQQNAENVRTRVYLAWLAKITGERSGSEVVSEAREILTLYPRNALALEFLGQALVDMGEFGDARDTYTQLVSVLEAAKPPEHMRIAFAYKELANNTRLAHGGARGEDLMRRAEHVYSAAAKPNEAVYASISNDFGGFHLARWDIAGAKERYERALEYYRRPGAEQYPTKVD